MGVWYGKVVWADYKFTTGATMETTYIVQGFSKQKDGKKTKLIADTAMQFKTEHEALMRAEKMSSIRVGVIAASQQYDADTGEYGEVKILVKYGELPAGMGDEE